MHMRADLPEREAFLPLLGLYFQDLAVRRAILVATFHWKKGQHTNTSVRN